MNIGLDYYNTITNQPDLFRGLVDLIHKFESKVLVVSAVSTRADEKLLEYEKSMVQFAFENRIEVDEFHTVMFNEPREIPELKRKKCAELGIDYFFDDRKDVCLWLTENGVKAYQVKK